jgi:uncharacterized surface protein with fasciclin (FAS1) repeats
MARRMYPSKNIIENAVNSKDHTTLVAAVSSWFSRNTSGKTFTVLHLPMPLLLNYQWEQLKHY